jgi:two-component system sensor histidine kinase HydH
MRGGWREMFNVRSSESPTRVPVTAAIVLATLVLALVLCVTAVVQVLDEYRLLGNWLSRPGGVPGVEIRALREDSGSSRSVGLYEVKLLAHDILTSLNEGVITTDQQAMATSINSTAIQLLGIECECIGRPIASISSAEVPLEALSRGVTERKETVSDRELTLDRAGRVCRLLASALDLKDTRGATIGCVIHLRDVTERMLMKEQMWRMEQYASLSTLASGLHHEIKNPITALSIHVQLLEERLQDAAADASIAEVFGVLKSEVRRLNITLESFRNFACLERLQLRRVDVQEVLEDVIRLIRPQATQQGVRVELLRAEGGLPRVALDPEKIEQAVLNLVLNALEAMPRGGELSLRATVEDGGLRVLVRDSGPGIPAEIQDHIFRPYFSTKDHGTGIGLTLAEKLVRQHRGRLAFRTGPGGTSFAITLPVNGQNGGVAAP